MNIFASVVAFFTGIVTSITSLFVPPTVTAPFPVVPAVPDAAVELPVPAPSPSVATTAPKSQEAPVVRTAPMYKSSLILIDTARSGAGAVITCEAGSRPSLDAEMRHVCTLSELARSCAIRSLVVDEGIEMDVVYLLDGSRYYLSKDGMRIAGIAEGESPDSRQKHAATKILDEYMRDTVRTSSAGCVTSPRISTVISG